MAEEGPGHGAEKRGKVQSAAVRQLGHHRNLVSSLVQSKNSS